MSRFLFRFSAQNIDGDRLYYRFWIVSDDIDSAFTIADNYATNLIKPNVSKFLQYDKYKIDLVRIDEQQMRDMHK